MCVCRLWFLEAVGSCTKVRSEERRTRIGNLRKVLNRSVSPLKSKPNVVAMIRDNSDAGGGSDKSEGGWS